MSQTSPAPKPSGSSGARKPSAKAKRSAARLAAVQALYQMAQTGIPADHVIIEFSRHRFGEEVEGEEMVPPAPDLFETIVRGADRHQAALDAEVDGAMTGGVSGDRIELLLRCILRCGAFELDHMRDTPAAVVISVYVDVCNAFFAGPEPKIVNGVLDRLAKRLGGGEHPAD